MIYQAMARNTIRTWGEEVASRLFGVPRRALVRFAYESEDAPRTSTKTLARINEARARSLQSKR